MRSLALALVGLGRWGRNYLRTVRETGLFRLAAVCDTDPLVEPPADVTCCRSVDELLGQPGLDAAVIATPHLTHADLTRQCLEAGLDVLVEKPMARTGAEAAALLELAKRRSRVLAAAFPTLYLNGYDRARSRLAGDHANAKVCIESFRTSPGLTEPDSDVLWDLAPHDLALGISLFGHPTAIALERNRTRAEFRVGFEGGVALRGAVQWRAGNPERWFRVSCNGSPFEIREEAVTAPFDRPLARLLTDFRTACRQRGEPRCSARLGLEVVRCLESLDALQAASLTAAACRT